MNNNNLTIVEFLAWLNQQEIKVSTNNGKLFCDAPKNILSSTIQQEIRNRKAENIDLLERLKGVAQDRLPAIVPISRNGNIPLSFNQERLWFFDRLENSKTSYIEQSILKISGKLDLSILKCALSAIVRRHEILRTIYVEKNGLPQQKIYETVALPIEQIDLQQLTENKQQDRIQQEIKQQANTPFDLEKPPLIRCHLWQLHSSEYILLFTMHHIIFDVWSTSIFIQELSSLYRAFSQGKPSPLPELPIQYADFAGWQRKRFQEATFKTKLDYWKQELTGIPEILSLPCDRPRPPIQSYRGATQTYHLNTQLTQKLQHLTKQSGTTLFMVLQTGFASLLYRYSGQPDIVTGSPIANRNHRESEFLIGFFANTLVLRTCFADNPSFSSLLGRVRMTTLQAYEHQDVSFEQIVEALKPQRSLSHSPLFQVMFVLQNSPQGKLKLPGLTFSRFERENTVAKFDIKLSISEKAGELIGSWEYSTDLFDAFTIERMAGHFKNLLSAIAENPEQKIESIPLLSKAEKQKLLVDWNDTAVTYPSTQSLHQLFEERVNNTPDAVAAVFQEEHLSYSQLNQKANQLAHYLKHLGVKPETLVGICIERSLEMVVGLLAILKAGGAYIPLDPQYPRERLEYMLADSMVSILLTQKTLLPLVPQNSVEVICLDTDWQTISTQPRNNLKIEITAENPIYAIYTSGSTGKPKGVINTHKGIINRLQWMKQQYEINGRDRILQKTSFSFDVSVWEFFLPLISGARIVLAQPEGHKDSSYLVDLIIREEITTLHFVPSMLSVFLEQSNRNFGRCSSLKRVFCSGEPLSKQLSQKFFTKLKCELHNLYGPTEAAIDVTYWRCKPDSELSTVPIGKPIANTQIYILDKHLQPVPLGVPGEIYIAGDGVAQGYLNQEELTQEKFISNPFIWANASSPLLYKTGDKGRYLDDGNIEYLGRLDNQVKLRGFRIELGEIEKVLEYHSQVKQAVVLVKEDENENKSLVAYIRTDKSLSVRELREYAVDKLPEYMIPGKFICLSEIPLTANGKVDRKKLLNQDVDISLETEYVAPRNKTEALLVEIWTEVLKVDSIGIRDNFFALGGDSLIAIGLVSQIQQKFQKDIPLATLFQTPTIEKIAPILNSHLLTKKWSPLVPIQPNGSLTPLFGVPGIGGNVLCFRDLSDYLGENQPFYGLQAQGVDGKAQPLESVEEIASQYIKAIKTVQPTEPYFLLGHSFGGYVVYEMAQQLKRQEESIGLVCILDKPAPLLECNRENIFTNWNDSKLISEIAKNINQFLGKDLQISQDIINSLTEQEQIKYFKQQLEKVKLLPINANMSLVYALLEVYRVQSQINYLPNNISPIPITLFRTNKKVQQQNSSNSLALGWNQFADGEVEVNIVPGNHMSMLRKPYVKTLTENLRKSLRGKNAD